MIFSFARHLNCVHWKGFMFLKVGMKIFWKPLEMLQTIIYGYKKRPSIQRIGFNMPMTAEFFFKIKEARKSTHVLW